MDTVDTDMYAS